MKYQNFTIFGIFSFHITSQTPPRNTTNRKLLNFETDQHLQLLRSTVTVIHNSGPSHWRHLVAFASQIFPT